MTDPQSAQGPVKEKRRPAGAGLKFQQRGKPQTCGDRAICPMVRTCQGAQQERKQCHQTEINHN